jgi:DNA-directed RNA polymerase specialized sigma24 family protein
MSYKNGYDPSIRDELERIEWNSILPRAIKFALIKEKMLRRLGSELTYEDLIQEAITRLYGIGEGGSYRNWNYKKYNATVFLKFVIKDLVKAELKKLARYKKEPLYRENGSEKNLIINKDGLNIADLLRTKSLEDIVIDAGAANDLLSKLEEISDDNEDLGMVIMCYEDGISKPREIAEITGFDKDKVNNLKRTLKRKLKLFDPGIKNNPSCRGK